MTPLRGAVCTAIRLYGYGFQLKPYLGVFPHLVYSFCECGFIVCFVVSSVMASFTTVVSSKWTDLQLYCYIQYKLVVSFWQNCVQVWYHCGYHVLVLDTVFC